MKLRLVLLCMVLLPVLSHAEIYKWKDKDGKVRYSDVPPPSNTQTESLYGKKIPRPTGLAPLTPVEGDATVAANKQKEMDKQKSMDDIAGGGKGKQLTKEEEAAKRAKDAEEKKKADTVKAEDLKIKQENCKSAQNNLKTYTTGGRLSRINAQGEREYMGDADIAKAKGEAQADIDKYCN